MEHKHASHAAIVRKLSNATYPGFDEFRGYIRSFKWRFPYFAKGIVSPDRPSSLFVRDDAVWFGDNTKKVTEVQEDLHGGEYEAESGVEVAAVETERTLNSPIFRALWNLLPAGTDAFTAFVQIQMLKDCPIEDLDSSGTFTIRVASYPVIIEHQTEVMVFRDHRKHLSVLQSSWGASEVTVCL